MTLFNASGELVPEYDKGGLPTLALSIDQGHGVPYSAEDLTAKSGQPPRRLHHAVQQVPLPECCVHLVSFGFQIWPPVYQGITGDHYIWRLEQEKRKIMKVQCWVGSQKFFFLSFFYNVFFSQNFQALFLWWNIDILLFFSNLMYRWFDVNDFKLSSMYMYLSWRTWVSKVSYNLFASQ